MSTRYVYDTQRHRITLNGGSGQREVFPSEQTNIYYGSSAVVTGVNANQDYVAGELTGYTEIGTLDYYEDEYAVIPAGNYFSAESASWISTPANYPGDVYGTEALYYAREDVQIEYFHNDGEGSYFEIGDNVEIANISWVKNGSGERVYSGEQDLTGQVRNPSDGDYLVLSYAGEDSIDPSGIVLEGTPTAGKSATVRVLPSNGNRYGGTVNYRYEYAVNGATNWLHITTTAAESVTLTIPAGTKSIAVRASAASGDFASADYAESTLYAVQSNRAPTVISNTASGANIGTRNEGFALSYMVEDADGGAVTVYEYLDGREARRYAATLGASVTIPWLQGEEYRKVLNGTHEVKVIAHDGEAESEAWAVTFTKKVTSASVTLATPIEDEDAILTAVGTIVGSIPSDANLQVLLTNNAKDPSPVWEDATECVRNGTNHVFANLIAQNGFSFNFRLMISRGASDVGGYITRFGGAFA